LDFVNVRGQEALKPITIARAGSHNLLMIGTN
jgi:predicted ATPase with chaperone activity